MDTLTLSRRGGPRGKWTSRPALPGPLAAGLGRRPGSGPEMASGLPSPALAGRHGGLGVQVRRAKRPARASPTVRAPVLEARRETEEKDTTVLCRGRRWSHRADPDPWRGGSRIGKRAPHHLFKELPKGGGWASSSLGCPVMQETWHPLSVSALRGRTPTARTSIPVGRVVSGHARPCFVVYFSNSV